MCCHCCMTTRRTIDIPSLRNTTEIYTYIYKQMYIYRAKLLSDDEICISFTQLNQSQQITEILFSLQLQDILQNCASKIKLNYHCKLSLFQKRTGQHLKYWDTSNKPAISSSYLSYCNLCECFFFKSYHEVASKLSDEKYQPLCCI